MKKFITSLLALFAVSAFGQQAGTTLGSGSLPAGITSAAGNPIVDTTGTATLTNKELSANTTQATGGSVERTLAARAADVINVADYGAKCDGSTDDSAAFNAAINAVRSRSAPTTGGFTWFIGKAGRVVAPSGKCVINEPINVTSSALTPFAATISIATPAVITASNLFAAGAPITFSTSGSLPNGITAGTIYYVSSASLSTSSFQIAATMANAIAGTSSIATTGSQSGTQTVATASTNLYGSGFVFDMSGTTLLCNTNGLPCFDLTGTGQATIINVNIAGNCSANTPSIGIALGRQSTTAGGADNNHLIRPTVAGCFTLTPYYNNQSETTLVDHGSFADASVNAYGAIWTGSNYFNFQSPFTGEQFPTNTYYSFNENTCIECTINVSGIGGISMFLGGTERHKFINTYISTFANPATTPAPAIVLYFGTSGHTLYNDFLDLDVHSENDGGAPGSLNADILFAGGATTAITENGLHLRDQYAEQSGPLFKRDTAAVYGTAVSTVTINNASFEIGTLAGTSPSWWDTPADFSVNGYIFNFDGSYVAPGSFTGTLCNVACTASFSLPSPLVVGSITNQGSVTGITVSTQAIYSQALSAFPGTPPTCTIAAPTGTGAQATCSVPYWTFQNEGPITNQGTGYAVNDVITLVGGTQYAGSSGAVAFTVTSVGGSGNVTGISQVQYTQYYSVAPTGAPTFTTSGSGTGFAMSTLYWAIHNSAGVTLISGGGGYSSAPAVTFGSSGACSGSCVTFGTTVSASLALTAANGDIQLNSTGTELGIAGSGGAPTVSLGALIDNSGVEQSLGSTYTVPANTSLVRFTQSTTVASSTVTLPTALADGQSIQFLNYSGVITALTFSPSVTGWTNGATFAANSALRVQWDGSGSSAWHLAQTPLVVLANASGTLAAANGGLGANFQPGATSNSVAGQNAAVNVTGTWATIFGAYSTGPSISGNYTLLGGAHAGEGSTGGHNVILAPNSSGSYTCGSGTGDLILGYNQDCFSSTASNEINIGGMFFLNNTSTAAPTIACGTGTNGTVDSHANSKSGTLTSGTTSVSTCTITFASAYTNWIHCRVTAQTPADLTGYSYTTGAITLIGAAVSQKYDYDCDGY